jgi:hypothetical protein
LDGVGHAVVLAGLPDDWIGVVLAAVVDGHPDSEGEGGFAVTNRLAAVIAVLVGGDAVVGVEPVEDAFGVAKASRSRSGWVWPNSWARRGVVVAVAGLKVAAEAVGDLVDGPVLELVAAEGGRGLQVRQQFHPAVGEMAVGGWRPGRGGV